MLENIIIFLTHGHMIHGALFKIFKQNICDTPGIILHFVPFWINKIYILAPGSTLDFIVIFFSFEVLHFPIYCKIEIDWAIF